MDNNLKGTYGDYIKRLSRKVNARLADIEAIYNFELGDEFEVAVCHLLSDILPNRFGVCRGFVVTEAGETAGDDVIIFDQLAYPMLRTSAGPRFAISERIPVDAVYAYIECKHSIIDDDVFDKAMEQVRNVKSLLLKRPGRNNPDYEIDGPIYNEKLRDWPRTYPKLKNQPFCVIAAKHSSGALSANIKYDHLTPDLLILGENHVATQNVALGPDGIKGALFFDNKHWARMRVEKVSNSAFGVGIVTLMQALSWIELIPIDWSSTLNTAYWNALFEK